MKDIEEITLKGDRVFLKKSFLGWKVVYPYKVDGKINWKNLISGGHWIKLISVIFLVAIILLAIQEYYSNLKLASACLRALPDYIDLSQYIKNVNLVNNFTGF